MKSISCATTLNILSLLDTGHSVRDISSRIGVSIGTVSSVRNNHRPDMSKTLGGHPKKLTESDIRLGLCAISSGKADTAVQVHKILRDKTNEDLSVQTVRRGLKQAGMKSTVKTTRPFLSKHHRRERLDFAIAHKDWTVADWKRLIWSDESKINRFGSDGRKWVWKKPRECLSDRTVNTTLKFGGGSIMIWGCMTWEGVGYLCKIDGKMDQHLYCQILEDDLQATLEHYGWEPEDVIFQQDNDPKHTSKMAREWFQDHGISVLPWPAQSPDLNPIEHLWSILKRKLAEYEEAPAGIIELWERVQVEWEKIGVESCQRLIESMPRRMEAVIKAKGGYTKY